MGQRDHNQTTEWDSTWPRTGRVGSVETDTVAECRVKVVLARVRCSAVLLLLLLSLTTMEYGECLW